MISMTNQIHQDDKPLKPQNTCNEKYVMKNNGWQRIVLIEDKASFYLSKMTRKTFYILLEYFTL